MHTNYIALCTSVLHAHVCMSVAMTTLVAMAKNVLYLYTYACIVCHMFLMWMY